MQGFLQLGTTLKEMGKYLELKCISLFVIPVNVDIHGHRFEIFTLVSEIHENVDLDLGIKNISELKGAIDLCDCCSSFLNRSIPFFP